MSVQAGRERPSPFEALRGRNRPGVMSMLGIFFVVLIVVWLARNFVDDPQEFLNVALIGLTTGAVYALIALGYTLVYGILQLINFAHGDVFALSGLISSSIMIEVLHLSGQEAAIVVAGGILLTILMTMGFASTLNASIEFLGYRRLRSQPRLTMLISAVGMSFIVQNVALAIYDVNFRSAPPLIPSTPAFTLGEVSLAWNKLTVILITIPVLVVLTWLVRSTKQGKAMRATAQDQDAAAMMGINVNRTISFTFVLAGGLAGAAGVLFLLQFNMRYDTGFELGLIAFTAAVLGGIGNLAGATLGGLLIGFIQAFNEGLTIWSLGSDWTRSIVFGILIAILVFRPEGLLGERTPEGA
ncbi:MAG TPA: branched-chain amino acid ABC transporter permease [Gaiellaceae bacterium]|nr:branched-chain amino acid ABC transporter permease [Gaiellaceae bacterium]